MHNLTGFQSNKFELIYQATRDGFKSINFHSKCDNTSDTLTLIKTTKSYIFGGYTSQTWSFLENNQSDEICYFDCFKSDSKSFLISLINKHENNSFRLNIRDASLAIDAFYEYGPSFGKGDIFISDLSNKNTKSSSELSAFSITNENSIIDDLNILAGEKYFQTIEIETYKIKFT